MGPRGGLCRISVEIFEKRLSEFTDDFPSEKQKKNFLRGFSFFTIWRHFNTHARTQHGEVKGEGEGGFKITKSFLFVSFFVFIIDETHILKIDNNALKVFFLTCH